MRRWVVVSALLVMVLVGGVWAYQASRPSHQDCASFARQEGAKGVAVLCAGL